MRVRADSLKAFFVYFVFCWLQRGEKSDDGATREDVNV
jgi:hypothetical protein